MRTLVERCLQKHPHARLRAIRDARTTIEQALDDFQRPAAVTIGEPPHAAFFAATARAMVLSILVVALASVGLYVKGTSSLELVPISSQRQLTSGHALETEPAIRPTGRPLRSHPTRQATSTFRLTSSASEVTPRSSGYVS